MNTTGPFVCMVCQHAGGAYNTTIPSTWRTSCPVGHTLCYRCSINALDKAIAEGHQKTNKETAQKYGIKGALLNMFAWTSYPCPFCKRLTTMPWRHQWNKPDKKGPPKKRRTTIKKYTKETGLTNKFKGGVQETKYGWYK